jgi:hypothetical protein
MDEASRACLLLEVDSPLYTSYLCFSAMTTMEILASRITGDRKESRSRRSTSHHAHLPNRDNGRPPQRRSGRLDSRMSELIKKTAMSEVGRVQVPSRKVFTGPIL